MFSGIFLRFQVIMCFPVFLVTVRLCLAALECAAVFWRKKLVRTYRWRIGFAERISNHENTLHFKCLPLTLGKKRWLSGQNTQEIEVHFSTWNFQTLRLEFHAILKLVVPFLRSFRATFWWTYVAIQVYRPEARYGLPPPPGGIL